MTRKRFRTALALFLGISLSLTYLCLVVPTALAAPNAPSHSELETEVIDVTEILEPGSDLEVKVAVRNAGDVPIADAALALRLQSSQLISRSAVDMWGAEDEQEIDPLRSAGQVITRVDVAELAPGVERVETLKISTDRLSLPKSTRQWGPRGIAVDTLVDSQVLKRERSFVVWFPADPADIFPTRISLLTPLVGAPPGADNRASEEERLQNLLAATSNFDTSFALDPQLLTEDGANIPIALLEDALAGKEVFALPHFDADVMALSHLDQIDAENYLGGARAMISSHLDTSASDVLLWPEGAADQALAQFAADFAANGVGAIVTNGTQLEPVTPLTYTTSGRARLVVGGSVVPTLISENTMATTLTASATAGVTSAPVLARQRLLADSAVITQERPADPRHMLLTVPRNWNPDPERATALLGSLAAAPWVQFEAVRSLIGAPATEIEREPLPGNHHDSSEIDDDLMAQAHEAAEDISEFRSIVERPEVVMPRADAQLQAIVANGWRRSPQERNDLVAQIVEQATRLNDSIDVIPAGAVNLITDAGEIPVLIENRFDQDVSITVRLHSDSSFLKTDQPVLTELPAQSETSVLVPAEAIGNRDVDVTVRLETATGKQIGSDQAITVRVRAGWEDAGTRIVGGALIVLFIIGIIRTVRRGRKKAKS
ncbi:MAG TPA: DUF6049 family protein [Actinomycetales bacterium]|nr:DUF6049 family protein [Actinomycetales bacterium]